MSGVLQRVGAGEAALLGLNMLELSPAGVDAIQQLRASIIKHVSTTQNFLQRAMWTRSEDVAELAKKSLETTKHRVAQALQEVPMIYARETHEQLSHELGLERFIYLGPSDTRNRPFCRAKVGKVFSRQEINALDNGQGLDVMTRCGGWGCRHHWRGFAAPVPSFLAIDKKAFFDASDDELSAWDQDFIDRGVEPTIQDFVSLFVSLSQNPNDRFNIIADQLSQGDIKLRVLAPTDYSKQLSRLGFSANAMEVAGVTSATTSFVNKEKLSAALVVHELTHASFAADRLNGFALAYQEFVDAKMWDGLYDAMLDEEVTAHQMEDALRQRLGLTSLFGGASEDDVIDFVDELYRDDLQREVQRLKRHAP